jgi:hypothetical protein
MKQLILVLLSVILFSCSPSADHLVDHHFEYVPVVSVEVPEFFVLNEVHQIKVKYALPNGCYAYYSHDYVYQGETREVTTIAIVNDEAACTQAIIEGEYTINVQARQQEVYTFKFWQGEGEYLTVIIPVI